MPLHKLNFPRPAFPLSPHHHSSHTNLTHPPIHPQPHSGGFGMSLRGKTYLYIEEALYLLSRKLLLINLTPPSSPSPQAATEKDLYDLLEPSGISLMIYLTYSQLRSETFVVLREGTAECSNKNRSRDSTADSITGESNLDKSNVLRMPTNPRKK